MNTTQSRKLFDCVTLQANNEECVILKVKPGSEMDLIEIGCFDGDETAFRLTKGDTQTCTIFLKNGKPFSWHWGYGGYAIVTDELNKAGKIIQRCIEQDFQIRVTR